MSDRGAGERAREIALARYGLRWHVPVYVLVNIGLVFVWQATGAGFFWPIFPIVFWGLGVLLHYRDAYRPRESTWVSRETERVRHELERAEEATRA